MGSLLAEQAKLIAPDVTVVLLKDTGHWVLEERRRETTEALMRFLSGRPDSDGKSFTVPAPKEAPRQ